MVRDNNSNDGGDGNRNNYIHLHFVKGFLGRLMRTSNNSRRRQMGFLLTLFISLSLSSYLFLILPFLRSLSLTFLLSLLCVCVCATSK